jgi:DNA-binding NtrC family response regulator
MAKAHILVVDDTDAILHLCAQTLRRLPNTEVSLENQSSRAIERLTRERFDLLLTDILMPGIDGIALLRIARQHNPHLLILMLTGFPTVETAVESMKLGAADYLTKPFSPKDLLATVQRLLQDRRPQAAPRMSQRQGEWRSAFDGIVGKSLAMQEVFETIQRLAVSDLDVLINGETGTGKELVARSIHRHSQRQHARFVAVDCGAIPESLAESELFGHERGAFTGAYEQSAGLLELADGGTVFLDEIINMPLPLQAKLLRALQERTIRRVGGKEEIAVNLRVIAATGGDMTAAVHARKFRADLYYRLNVGCIVLPPLRQRPEDIPLLALHFVARYAQEMGKPPMELTPESLQALTVYPWPGNVRELQNILKRMVALHRGPVLSVNDLPDDIVSHAPKCPVAGSGFFALREQRLAAFEKDYFMRLLQRHLGDVSQAAQEARVPRGTLYRLLKKHGLAAEDFRSEAQT